jgi:hypothetical protein
MKHNSGFFFKTIIGTKNYDNFVLGSKKNGLNELSELSSGRNHAISDNMMK